MPIEVIFLRSHRQVLIGADAASSHQRFLAQILELQHRALSSSQYRGARQYLTSDSSVSSS